MSSIRQAVAALALAALAAAGAGAQDAKKYEVKAPVKIQWWHALEAQYAPLVDKVVADFEKANPNIDVEAVYQGAYKDLNEKLIAAQAAGTTLPGLTVANTPLVAEYGASGLCEVLDPYIKATGFDVKDFGPGLTASTSYGGKQVSLPFLISTQIMFYNKDMADAEKIKLPETWAQMDEFMKKASKKAADGSAQRYATVIPGWDQWYFEPFYLNAGVSLVNKDMETTDLGGAKAVAVARKLKQWCDEKSAYWAYGKDASSVMRQNFIDGKTFSVIHTTSLYNMYADTCKFKVGMHYLPGDAKRDSEVGGSVLLIPAKNSQEVKNAAWKLLTYLTSKEVNMYWARGTGYMPTRESVTKTAEGQAFLKEKPAFKAVFDNIGHIYPRIQHPAYSAFAKIWMQEMAKVIIEGGDMEAAMKKAAVLLDEALQD
ncbi:MAG TPA: extracellular solute-binding protein [Spirochaetia bacterium]|nr:extracellular solute-binding protein [Spirochaetia bacterium]HRZ63723.1 extracellular solute-binding protein [Spirochaetia bacterium]